METLEPRLCLALAVNSNRMPKDGGSIQLKDSVLSIKATDENDDIRLTSSAGSVVVSVGNRYGSQYSGTWSQGSIKRIDVDAGRGGDLIDCRGLTVPTKVFGSYGSDLMYGGDSADEFYGGNQEDLFIANKGAANQDFYDGGDDTDGLITQGTSVRRTGVDSIFGTYLPFEAAGWQRSASGKWEVPLVAKGVNLPKVFDYRCAIRAALTADGLSLGATVNPNFIPDLLGVAPGQSAWSRNVTLDAVADKNGTLTFRWTEPVPLMENIPSGIGTAISVLEATRLVKKAEIVSFWFRWDEFPQGLVFGFDYTLRGSTSIYVGNGIGDVPVKFGVDVGWRISVASNGYRNVFNTTTLRQMATQSTRFFARSEKFGIVTHLGCGGAITPTEVRFRIDGVGTVIMPV